MSQGEPEEAPGKVPPDKRLNRTVKRRKNRPNRVEKPCGLEVAGFRMVRLARERSQMGKVGSMERQTCT